MIASNKMDAMSDTIYKVLVLVFLFMIIVIMGCFTLLFAEYNNVQHEYVDWTMSEFSAEVIE
jgi:Trk-type K+ transport system membrane component